MGRAPLCQLQGNIGILLLEHRQHQRHHLHGPGDADAQPEPSGVLLPDLPELTFQLRIGGQDPLGGMEVFFPRVGQTHGAGAAVEDGQLRLLLQLPEHLAQRGLRNEQFFGGSGDAAAFGDGFHILRLLEIHKISPRICQFSTRIIIYFLFTV